jgi:hypothetical protein
MITVQEEDGKLKVEGGMCCACGGGGLMMMMMMMMMMMNGCAFNISA